MLAIKNIRESKHMSQAALAKKVSITRAHLCNIEKGKVGASLELVKRLAEVLEVTPQEIRGQEGSTVEYDSEEISDAIEKAFRCYKDGFEKKKVVKIGMELFKIYARVKSLQDDKSALDKFRKELREKELIGLAAKCYLEEDN